MKRLFNLLLMLVVPLYIAAQPSMQLIEVQIVPDRADFIYKEGKPVKFTVTVLKNKIPMPDAEVTYLISEDMMKAHESGKMTLKGGTATIDAGTMNKPGFLRCQVWTKYNEREYQGVATVGFSPEKLRPVTKLPEDFKQFWNDAIANARKHALEPRVTLVPERCTDKIDMYHVSFQNNEWGSRIYGMLAVPKGGGKYPAVLKVPGAGVRAYNGDTDNANRGYITLEIGVHGIPVNLPGGVYSDLYNGPLKNYHTFNLDNRDMYYYKRIYLGCVRAIDYLFTRPEFDGQNLLVYGGSQGGALAIVTAGLDERVTGLVSYYPALCDMVGYLHDRAGGWPHMFKKAENNTPEKIETAAYYDVVNFARNIKVPGFYSFGYNDMVCPPTTMFSAVNVVTAPKEVMIVEETAHFAYREQHNEAWKWVKNLWGK